MYFKVFKPFLHQNIEFEGVIYLLDSKRICFWLGCLADIGIKTDARQGEI